MKWKVAPSIPQGVEGAFFLSIFLTFPVEHRSQRSSGYSARWRPYRAEYTGSLPNSEVNRRRARSVLNWGTVREHPWVLPAFCFRLLVFWGENGFGGLSRKAESIFQDGASGVRWCADRWSQVEPSDVCIFRDGASGVVWCSAPTGGAP